MSESPLKDGCEIRCRACSHRSWSTEESENQKADWLRKVLSPWKERIEPVQHVLGDERWGYRRKICLHAQWQGDHWAMGLLVRKNPIPEGRRRDLYEVLSIPNCPIHHSRVNQLVQFLCHHLPGPSQLPLVYVSIAGSQVTLVLKSSQLSTLPDLPWSDFGVSGLWMNLNPSAGNRVFSSRGWHLVWGKENDIENGFVYGPSSFQQLIPHLHQKALEEAENFLAPQDHDCVLDLYSGVGRSLKVWRDRTARMMGVELCGEAFHCSEINVGVGTSWRGKTSDRLVQFDSWLHENRKASFFIYMNPPRLGLEEKVAKWIAEVGRPERMAYLSCSAGTLARDLSVFSESGYSVVRITPYDFFPQTHHVETLVLLAR